MRVKVMIFFLLLLVIYFSVSVFANQYFSNIDEDLPYRYSFSQKYIVAGERVLNLTISNNGAHNIEAVEFEIRLKNAFGDVISEWNTFTDPDLQIPAHTSKSLTLTLTRRNIFGAKIENVLDQTRFIDLRYKRILLDNDVLLTQKDLYPEIQYNYGSFKVELDVINNKNINDLTNYNFEKPIIFEKNSIAHNRSISKKEGESKGFDWNEYYKFNYIDQIVNTFSEDCLIILAAITNISNEPQKKDWLSGYLYAGERSVFTLVDDKKNQYNRPSLAYLLSGWEVVGKGKQGIYPGVTFSIVYVFDKINDYTPKELKVYIDEQEHYKIFLRKDGKYIADNE